MNLQAKFPAGETSTTVHGLYQWDYGRKLEIESDSLIGKGVVEVHFACPGMLEAVVRSCAVLGTTVTAAIPDTCLEQTAPIFAWVYCTDDTEGFTVLKVTMPVNARTRPSGSATEPPASYSDKYTELIAATNELAAAFSGYVTALDALVGGDTQ